MPAAILESRTEKLGEVTASHTWSSAVDQVQTSAGGGAVLPVERNAAGSVYSTVAQRFRVTKSGPVYRLSAYMRSTATTTAADLTFRVQADDAGVPSGTDLWSGALAGFTSTSFAWRDVFPTDLVLEADKPYWLIVEAQSPGSGTNEYEWEWISPGAYTRGYAKQITNGAPTYTPGDSGTDMVFRVNMPASQTLAVDCDAYIDKSIFVWCEADAVLDVWTRRDATYRAVRRALPIAAFELYRLTLTDAMRELQITVTPEASCEVEAWIEGQV